MAFKKVNNMSDRPLLSFGEDKEGSFQAGDTIEGYIKGKRDTTTQHGPAIVWTIKTADGEFDFFAPTVLRNALLTIKLGTLVQITYTGDKPSKKNKRVMVKMFDVAQDEDSVLDASEIDVPRQSFQGDEQEAEDDVDQVQADEEEEQQEEEEQPKQVAKPASRPASAPAAKPAASPNVAAKSSTASKLAALAAKTKSA